MLAMIGIEDAAIVVLIVAVIFGPSRLPQIGEGVGKMIANFRRSMREANSEAKTEDARQLAQPATELNPAPVRKIS